MEELNWHYLAFLAMMIALISLVMTKVGAVMK